MKDVVEKIKSNKRLSEVLCALAKTSPQEYAKASQMFDDQEVAQLGDLISTGLITGGVDTTLATGGLLFIYQAVTDCEERRGLPNQLLDDMGVSKTQAYRCVDVWEQFGKLLVENRELKPFFVVEALKILSSADVSQSARDEAIEMARNKQKVRIAVAEMLVTQFETEFIDPTPKKHGERRKTAQQNPQSLRGKRSSTIWEYAGKAIRFALRPTQSKKNVDHEAIIKDLEAALAQYRDEFARIQTEAREPDRNTVEVSHAGL